MDRNHATNASTTLKAPIPVILALCLIVAGSITIWLAACSKSSGSTTPASTASANSEDNKRLDPKLSIVYMRARADLMDHQAQLENKLKEWGKPVDKAIQEMVLDCRSKNLGNKIFINNDGIPSCMGNPVPAVPPTPGPVTPVAPPAPVTPEKK